jgi:hypothetical protein
MNLSSHTLLDIYGASRRRLDGEYSAESLATLMVAEWLPYWECHKCGRFDYCKFVQRLPHNPNRARDIHCGVAESALRLFVEKTFPLLPTFTSSQIQNYLDAAFYYAQFILDSEIDIGHLLSREHVEYWLDLGPETLTGFVRLRELLDALADNLRNLPHLLVVRPVLFVEGETEKAFLEQMRESHSAHFLNLLVEVYGGTGNRRPNRIEMLLVHYVRRGYKVCIQGDADGSSKFIFEALVKRGHVAQDNTFIFAHDFETSVPAHLLFTSLKRLGLLSEQDADAFVRAHRAHVGAVSPWLRDAYGIDLSNSKIHLAQTVADLLNQDDAWWIDDTFMATELGTFLQFIQRIL